MMKQTRKAALATLCLGLLALAVKTVMDALSVKKADKTSENSKLTADSASTNPPTHP